MSILSGFFKTIKYRMTDQGYKWQSEKTSSQTVVMGDGTDNTDTAEKRFGAIKGLTSSTSVTDTGYALDATIGKKHEDSIAALNQSLSDVNSYLSEFTHDMHLTTITGANGDIDLPVFGTGKRVIYAYNNANLFVIPRFISARNCWGVKVLNDNWIPVANTEVTIYYVVIEAKR